MDNPFDPMQAILSQLNNSDPQMKQLIEQQLLANQQKKKAEVTAEDILRKCKVQNKRLFDQANALKEQLKKSKGEQERAVSCLDYFLKVNNTLAAALGSCENCWGEDQSCETCGGEGIPGWRDVNKRLFNIYVQPCLEKVYGQGRTSGNGSQTMN